MRVRAMSIVLFATLMLAFKVPAARAATCDVFGLMSSNTTWSSASCQQYVVTGNVTVDTGVTLTVEAGTIVKFNTARGLIVKGTLIARGTATSRVIFTSNLATPQHSDWSGIEFAATSPDASFDASGAYTGGSIIQYATVEYAGNKNTTAIKADSVAPYINHTIIRNNADRAIYISYRSGLKVHITDNVIEQNGLAFNSGILDGGGIRVDGGVNDVPGNSAFVISRNIIRKNIGGRAGGIFLLGGSGVVTDNVVEDNQTTGLGGGIWARAAGKIIISGNTIRKNRSGNAGGGIYAEGATQIIGNLIAENSAVEGGGIAFYADTRGAISGNLVTRNSATSSGGGIQLTGGLSQSVFPLRNNAFVDNLTKGKSEDLANGIHANTDNIDAENNWWGTTDRSAIGDRIFDNTDVANVGVVDFEPFLTQSSARLANISAASDGQTSLPDGTVLMNVPAGAFPADGAVNMFNTGQATSALPRGSKGVRHVIISAVANDGVPLTQLNQPVVISMSYTDAELAAQGISETSLTVAFWSGVGWVNVLPCAGCSVDAANNRVTVVVDHFSEFALINATYQIYLPFVKR